MGLTETFKAYLSSMILIMIFFSNVHIVIALINKVNYSNNSHPCALSATITIRVIWGSYLLLRDNEYIYFYLVGRNIGAEKYI